MYEYSPTPNRAPGLILGIIFFVSAVVLILPFQSDRLLASLLLGVGILFLMASCQVIERFVLTDYIYGIERTDRGTDFTVTAVRFKKNRTVCRVSAYDVSEIMMTSQHKRLKGVKYYNYCPDMLGKSRYFIRVSGDEDAMIKFVPDQRLINILTAFINEERHDVD